MDEDLALNRRQSRLVDELAIEKCGVSGLVLMENAGRGVVDVLLDVDPKLAETPKLAVAVVDQPPRVVIVCGKGNNAGDGFVIARQLEIRGVSSTVLLLSSPDELKGDAKTNFAILRHCQVPLVDLSTQLAGDVDADAVTQLLDQHGSGGAWLIDAMLGTGAIGAPRYPFNIAIDWMNRQPARRLAIDVPSGLDCDSGTAAAATVRADVTCTFVAQKIGFSQATAAPFLGDVRVVDIGLPPRLVRAYAGLTDGG